MHFCLKRHTELKLSGPPKNIKIKVTYPFSHALLPTWTLHSPLSQHLNKIPKIPLIKRNTIEVLSFPETTVIPAAHRGAA